MSPLPAIDDRGRMVIKLNHNGSPVNWGNTQKSDQLLNNSADGHLQI